MRAWRFAEYGSVAAPQVEDLAPLCHAPGEVHVATAYAVVNFADRLMMRGRYQVQPQLLFTPGCEVVPRQHLWRKIGVEI